MTRHICSSGDDKVYSDSDKSILYHVFKYCVMEIHSTWTNYYYFYSNYYYYIYFLQANPEPLTHQNAVSQ